MTWRFIVDANLPVALARAIEATGAASVHVTDLTAADADDAVIWRLASGSKDVIVSKDRDFADRIVSGVVGPRVLWLRVGNTRKAVLVPRIVKMLPAISSEFERGERLVEVR
jgi:predicted nuclease of predicted toxin-antitoxin system